MPVLTSENRPIQPGRLWRAAVGFARGARHARRERRAERDRRAGLRDRRQRALLVVEQRRTGPRDRRQYDRRRPELRVF